MTDSQNEEPVANGGVPTSNDQARGDDKPWSRAWEPKELRHHSTDWSLAADAGLLKYLQAFSARFMAKAHESTLGINDLVHETNMMDARMRNVADRFLTLSDSQFIENRVYDEDVSEDANGDSINKSKDEKKEDKKEIDPFPKLKEAIQSGLKVLDDVFDVLDANAVHSDYDSELDSDAEDGQGVNGMPTKLYEPKDPYVVRPLPHLIGSRGFLESDDVGIKDLPSDDEEVQDDEGSISESDDDVEKPSSEKKDSVSSSDYDSDTEYSEDEDKVAPADSTPKEQRFSESEDGDLFGKKSEDDFSEEEETSPPEKKKAPSKSKPSPKQKKKKDKPKKQEPDLFADDEEGDDLFANSGGLFGTGANLFDKKKTKVEGLFDDADVSDEGSDKESDEEMENKSQDLSSEEDEVAEERAVPPEKSSKPLGGVSLFGGALNKELLSRGRRDTDSSSQASEQSSKKASNLFLDEDEDDLFASKPPPKSNAQPKVKSILSDSEEEFRPPPIEKKLPSKDKKKKNTSILFGSESDEDDLFGGGLPKKNGPQITSASPSTLSSVPPSSKKKETPKPNIFDSGSSDDDSMFSQNPPAMEAPAKLVSKSKDVFDSDSDDDFFADVETKVTTKANTQPKPLLESDSDSDDMFSSIPATKMQPKVADAGNKDTAEVKRDKPVTKPKSDNLFDDDSEEQESENEKEEDEPLPSQKKKPVGAVSMFGGDFGGAELSAAISKRRGVSDISTKSSCSNDSEQPKEAKKNLGLFGDEEKEDVKKKHFSRKLEEKPAEKIESEPKSVTRKPTPQPKVIVNVTAKPFGKTALSTTPDPDAADSSKAQSSVNVTAKPFKPFGTSATLPKTDGKASSSPPKSSVGKLRAGLAINPSSLLPGAAPKPKPIIQAEISFDKPPVIKTLESFNKGRSRGQRNRRPPSRHFNGNLVVVEDKSGAPSFVEEKQKEGEKPENVGGNAVQNQQKPVDLPQKEEFMDIPVKKTMDKPKKVIDSAPRKPVDLPKKEESMNTLVKNTMEEPKNLIDSVAQKPADLAQEESMDIPVKKPKEKPKNLIDSADLDDELFSGSLFTKSDKKPNTKKTPKLFDDDIFGDADDFLNDLMPGKKKDKGEGLKVIDLNDDDDIFGDLSEGGIFSKPSKEEAAQKENIKTENKKLLEDDIFGDVGDELKAKQTKHDEDIFGDFASSIDAKPKGEVKTQSSKPIDDTDIFGDDDFDFSLPKSKGDINEDIFASDKPARKVPKIEQKKKPAAAKDDDIFGDDIFSDMPSKPASKKTSKKVEKNQKSSKSAAGASIFDDDGDASDIFASSSVKKKTKNPISKTKVPKKTEKETTSTVMDDPLSMP